MDEPFDSPRRAIGRRRESAERLCAYGVLAALAVGSASFSWAPAAADECPGNPQALGTERTIAVDPRRPPRIGSLQFPQSLPLLDHEIVLTFDDGPESPYTTMVLDALARECAKATFFILGANARKAPQLVRRIESEGHTIGTHSQTHPHLARRSHAAAVAEIENGIRSTEIALGDSGTPAPLFRAPYLETTARLEFYIAGRGLMLWSIDLDPHDADDGKRPTPDNVVTQALKAIERARKGILLMHDVQPATARALPRLLRELKARHYRIVHVVPRGPEERASAATAARPAVPANEDPAK